MREQRKMETSEVKAEKQIQIKSKKILQLLAAMAFFAKAAFSLNNAM